MDKLQALYDSFIAGRILSTQTSFEEFAQSTEEQKLFMHKQAQEARVLSTETDFATFESAWAEQQLANEEVKKKENSELNLANGSSEQAETNQEQIPIFDPEAFANREEPEYVPTNIGESDYESPYDRRQGGMYPTQEAIDEANNQGAADFKLTLQETKANEPANLQLQADEAATLAAEKEIGKANLAELLKTEDFVNALENTTSQTISQSETDAVDYFTSMYGSYGFIFRAAGANKLEVIAPGSVERETIILGGKGRLESVTQEQASKLKNFVSNYARPQNQQTSDEEQDVIDNAIKIANIRRTARINADGTESTVLLESANIDGKEVVYPTLFPKGETYGSDPRWWMEKSGMEAYEEAKKRGEVFNFDTEEAAQEFAEGSWKNISTVDGEAKAFYAERGLDYTTYKTELDAYEDIMDELRFIEGQRYDLAKTAGVFNDEGGFGTEEMPFREEDLSKENAEKYSALYVNGRRRQDILEYTEKLNLQAEELRETVNDTDFRRVREDFDLVIEKQLKGKIKIAAESNYVYKQEATALNEVTLSEFGVSREKLQNYKPKTSAEEIRINDLLVRNAEVEFGKADAAQKFEVAKTYLDAKVDRNARKTFVDNWASFSSSWSGGWANGKANQKILAMSMGIVDMEDDLSIREAAEYIVNQKNIQQSKPTGRALSRYHGALSYSERMDAFYDDPVEIAMSMAAQSISQMLPYGLKIVGAAVTAEAAVGGTMGATGFSAGPLGFATTGAGLIAGGIDGLKNGVATTMVALEYTNSFYEAVSNQGYKPQDADELVNAIKDPEVWAEAKRIGLARGLTIGVVDRISFGLAGRLFKVGALGTRTTRVAAGLASVATLDPISEGLGEYLAQKVAGQEESMAEVMDEIIGGVGMSAPFAAMNMYMDGRNVNNITIAEQFEDIAYMAESNYSGKKIADWTQGMLELGQISPESAQRINQNIGLRKDARTLLETNGVTIGKFDFSNNPALENRTMALLAAKEKLSETTNSREIFSETIKGIKNELAEIVSSKTLRSVDKQTNLQFKTFSGRQTSDTDVRVEVPRYTISEKNRFGRSIRKRYNKEEFLKRIKSLSQKEIESTDISVFNDAAVALELNELITTKKEEDAIRKSSTKKVDAPKQTENSTEVGERVLLENEFAEETNEEANVQDDGQNSLESGLEINPLEEEVASFEGEIEDQQNEILSIRQELKTDIAETRKKKMPKQEKADAIEELKQAAKDNIVEVKENISEIKKQIKGISKKLKSESKVLNEEVSDLENSLNDGPKVDFRMKEGLDGNIDNDIQIEAEELELNRMDAMVSGNEKTVVNSGKRVPIDGKELGSRTNRPVTTASLQIINGIPTVFTISDQLTTGNITNPETGNVIVDLKGGLGFTETEGNEGAAWANTTEKEANDMLIKAEEVYMANIPLFKKWWKENPEHNGLVPLTVVKMGEGSLLSNEATFRVLADNLTKIPKENKVKALEAFIEQTTIDIAKLEAAVETGIGLKGAKLSDLTSKAYSKTIKQKQELLSKAQSVESIEQLLDAKILKTLTLPSRRVLLETIAFGSPNRAGETTNAGKPNSLVPSILLENMPAESRTLLSLSEITDLITDPQMKNVPQRSVVAIQGIDVLNPEVIKTNHPNYDWGVRGRNIGVLEESIPIQDAFPTAFNNAIVGLTKDEAKGKTFTPKQVENSKKKKGQETLEEGQLKPSSVGTILTETVGVQNGLPGLEFIGAVTEGNIENSTKLINFLNVSFPSVAISTDAATFQNVIQSPGVKVYLKGNEVIYGVTVDGDIYINPQTHNSDSQLFNTAIHEMGHVWTDYLQTTKKGTAIYNKGAELVQQDAEFARQLVIFNGDIKKATNEAMAILIGNKGQSIADASLRSKFQEWLLGVWKSIKEQFSLSNDLTPAQIQALSLDEFLGTALADIFAGKKLKMTDAQLIQMKNPEAAFSSGQSMQGIIEQGRLNGFSDASIRVVLKNRKFPAKAINTAMKVHIDAFLEMPLEFTNVEGGVNVGRALFNELKDKVNDYANTTVESDGVLLDSETGKAIPNPRKRTLAEVRQKAQDLLLESSIYKVQAEVTQQELRVGFDRVLGTRANTTVSKEIAEIRNNLKQQKIGADNLIDAQKRLRNIVRKLLPKNTKYTKGQVDKLLRTINSTNQKNFKGKALLLMEDIVTIRETIRTNMIKDLLATVKKKAQFKKTESGKIRGKGVDAYGQRYFVYSKQVLDMVIANDIDGLTAFDKSINADQIDVINQKLANKEKISSEERFLLDKQLAYDTYADIAAMDYYQVEQVLADTKATAKESIARLNNRRALRRAETEKIVAEFDAQIERDFPELFGENGKLLEGNELQNAKASIRKSLSDKGLFKGITEFLSEFAADQKYEPTGLKKYLRNTSVHFGTLANVLDRGTRGNMFQDYVYKGINRADERYYTGVFVQEDKINAMAEKLGFKTWKDWKYSLGEDTISILNVRNSKTDNTYDEKAITKDKALRLLSLEKNKIQRDKLRAQGFTPAKMQQLEEFVGEDNMIMSDMVMDYFSNFYFESVNEVYIQANDIGLRKVENYFPTMTLSGTVTAADMLSGDFAKVFSAEFAPSLKDRTDVTGNIALGFDFSEVVEDHIQAMERYKAYALTVKQMNTVLKSPAINTLLRETATDKLFSRSLSYMINPTAGPKMDADATSWLQGRFVNYALSFKPIQVVKQASSFIQAFEEYSYLGRKTTIIPGVDLAIDMVGMALDYAAVLATLPKQIREAKAMSGTFKNRLVRGLEGDTFGLESGGRRNAPKYKNRKDKLGKGVRGFDTAAGFNTVAGDILGVLGYKAAYNRNIKNGMNAALALEKFNEYNSTQQTRRASEKVGVQQGTDTGSRFFTMFGSTIFLLMNKVMSSSNNIYSQVAQKKVPLTKDVRALALSWSAANAMFTMASYSGAILRGNDEERDEAWRQVKLAATGLSLVYQIPLIGAAIEEALNNADTPLSNKGRPVSEGVNPFTNVFRRVSKGIVEAQKGEASVAKVIVPVLELAAGVQTTAPVALFKTFGGDFSDENIYDLMGITKSYRPGYMMKKPVNKGMNKSDVKKLFPELYKTMYPKIDKTTDVNYQMEQMNKELMKSIYGGQ